MQPLKWSIRISGAPPLEVGQSYLYPRSIRGGAPYESSGERDIPPGYVPIQAGPQQQVCPYTYVVNDRHPSVIAVSLLFLDPGLENSRPGLQNIIPFTHNMTTLQTNAIQNTRGIKCQRIYESTKDFLDGCFVYLSGYDDSMILDDGFSLYDGSSHPAIDKSIKNDQGTYLVLAYRGVDWIQQLTVNLDAGLLELNEAPQLVFPDAVYGVVSGIVSWQ